MLCPRVQVVIDQIVVTCPSLGIHLRTANANRDYKPALQNQDSLTGNLERITRVMSLMTKHDKRYDKTLYHLGNKSISMVYSILVLQTVGHHGWSP